MRVIRISRSSRSGDGFDSFCSNVIIKDKSHFIIYAATGVKGIGNGYLSCDALWYQQAGYSSFWSGLLALDNFQARLT